MLSVRKKTNVIPEICVAVVKQIIRNLTETLRERLLIFYSASLRDTELSSAQVLQ